MARRSSARVRDRNSKTPQRVSLSHDACNGRTAKTVATKLGRLEEESDEMPGAFPSSPTDDGTPTRPAKRRARAKRADAEASSQQEMHEQKQHQTPAKTEEVFQFTFRREHSLELSVDAKRLMEEKREEAARIRKELMASGEVPLNSGAPLDAQGRRLAAPKSKKSSRFSEAHKAAFEKMDSIAGHASAFRAGRHVQAESATRAQISVDVQQHPATPQQQHAKSLRFHPSNPHLSPLTSPTQASLARANSVKSLKTGSKIPAPTLLRSPNKLIPVEMKAEDGPSTPLLQRSPSKATPFSKPATTAPTGTEGGVASPLLSRSPVKISALSNMSAKSNSDTSGERRDVSKAPLLAREPMKMSVSKSTSSSLREPQPEPQQQEPLLARSPLKMSSSRAFDDPSASQQHPQQKAAGARLLEKSPSKITLTANLSTTAPQAAQGTPSKPTASGFGFGLMSRFSQLRSSPMKSILRSPQRLYSDDPAKIAAGTHLATPPKMSSKSSQAQPRAKCAAYGAAVGAKTAPVQKHVDFSSSTKARYEASQSPGTPSKATEAVEAVKGESPESNRMEIDTAISYPALKLSTSPDNVRFASPSPQKRRQTVAPGDFTFRADGNVTTFRHSPNAHASSSNSKRPSIRAVSAEPEGSTRVVQDMVVPKTVIQGSKKRKFAFENDEASSHSYTDTTAAEKENTAPPTADDAAESGQRPAKRQKNFDLSGLSKHTAASRAKSVEPSHDTTKRRTTLGVKPRDAVGKGGVKPKGAVGSAENKKKGMISKERLAALATPKKRA